MAERSPLPCSVRSVLGSQASEDLMIWLETGHETLRAGIRADIHAELKALDDKLTDRIHQVDRHVGDAKADLMRWSFVFWVGAVAAVAAPAGVLRGL